MMAMAAGIILMAIAVSAMMNLAREAREVLTVLEILEVLADQDHAATIAPILPEDFLLDFRGFS
jgi:hypothetical protein